MIINKSLKATCTAAALMLVLVAGRSLAADETAETPAPEPLTPEAQRAASRLQETLPEDSEARLMLEAILEGSHLGPDEGWFRVAKAKTRFGWKFAARAFDGDEDARVTAEEFPGTKPDFTRLDRDGDGALTAGDFDFTDHALTRTSGAMLFFMADRDGNGHVTKDEFAALFENFDSGKRGFLSIDDLGERLEPPTSGRRRKRSAGGPSRSTLVLGLARQEIGSLQPGPDLDRKAPDFTLRTVDGRRTVTLSEEVGEKPVVLVFGNFTCGPFRSQSGNVHKLYERYKGRAKFFMVYVREAHPNDGWHMESNVRLGVDLKQPTTDAERGKVAQKCRMTLEFDMPFLVDSVDDKVGAAYSGMPSRLYVIDREGRVAYKSGRGPFGFKPAECEQSLVLLLTETERQPAKTSSQSGRPFPALENTEAWSRLPRPTPPLPVWARILSRPLPRTTAGMLHLDYVHRAQNPLGPVLRAKLRWVAADANRCAYSKQYAAADLARAGVDAATIEKLAGNWKDVGPSERAVLNFARKMTRAAHTVTDEEFAEVLKHFGPEKTVAIVHTLAHANFQDRLFLALGVEVEPGGPYPPLEVSFDPQMKLGATAPARAPFKSEFAAKTTDGGAASKPGWDDFGFASVQKLLANQKSRKTRIPLPDWDSVSKKLPPALRERSPSKIVWSNVSLGYQPQLTLAWFNCMRTFRQESDLDRVFANSMFWVITRSNECFY